VTGSNQRHSEYKDEIEQLQSRMSELEEENTELRKATSNTKDSVKEREVAQRQRDALDKLCENLRTDRDKLQEELRVLQAEADAS